MVVTSDAIERTDETNGRDGPEDGGENDLLAELAALDDEDRDALLTAIRKARKSGYGVSPVEMFHANSKSDLDDPAHAETFNDLSTVKAPPMIKEYLDAPRIELPKDIKPLPISLSEAILTRASVRDYIQDPISLDDLSALLHYSYGVRKRVYAYNSRGFPFRYVPSAGGLQSSEIYLVVNSVDEVPQGLYHYHAGEHALEELDVGYLRHRIASCSAFQDFLLHSGVVLILTAVLTRTNWKYGNRAYRFVHLDTGVLTQQIYLVATGLDLGVCAVAGFGDDEVDDFLNLDGHQEFSCLLVGLGKPFNFPA